MTFPVNPAVGQTVIAPAGGAFTWNGREWANIYFSVSPAPLSQSANFTRYNNPQLSSVMASPPTISQSTTLPAGLTNQYVWNDQAKGGALSIQGGVLTPSIGCELHASTISGSRPAMIGRTEFMTDAPVVSFGMWDPGNPPVAVYRWIVNGQFVSKSVYKNVGYFGGGGEIRYVTLDFSGVGGQLPRHIIMEWAIQFYSVNVAPTATVSNVGKEPLKVGIVGDSFNTAGGDTAFDGISSYLGDILGIQNTICLGVPTTGYLGGTGQLPFEQRIPDIQYVNPDILFITGGYNDATFPAAQLTAAVKSYIKAIRRLYPVMPIVAFGNFGGNRSAVSSWIVADNAINAAYADLTPFDPYLRYIKCMSDQTGSWMTGSGNVSNLKNDGNSDIYILNDDTHPNPAGKMYLAQRMADAYLALNFP